MTSPPDLATLKLDDFAPHLDTVFDMQLPTGAIPLKLVKAAPAGDSGRAGGAFSLLFTTASGAWLPQAIYLVEHPTLGAMEIFLVPIGPESGGNGYQAIFT
jgi:hypothetical protein